MEHSYNYSLIQISPIPGRGEWVNAGLVVFGANGADVRLADSESKLTALNPAFDIEQFRALPDEISSWLKGAASPTEQYQLLKNFGALTVTTPAYFMANTNDEYETAVDDLLDRLVTPPVKPAAARHRHSVLNSELRRIFRRYRVLSREPKDIDKHMVITEFPIERETNLYVEFALKNSVFNVTETIDYRARGTADTPMLGAPRFYETGAKALILQKAKDKLGARTRRYVIYTARASDRSQIRPYLKLLAESADEVLNRASASDMAHYTEVILKAAGKSKLFP